MTIKTASRDFIESTDLGLASALATLNFTIDHLNKQNPAKVIFFFIRTLELENAVNSYWSNQLQVPAQRYFNAIKSLKNQIYSQ